MLIHQPLEKSTNSFCMHRIFDDLSLAGEIISPIFDCYPMCTGILFVCFGWMACKMLETLQEESQQLFASNCNNSIDIFAKWKRHYTIICQFIEEINRSFGMFLLVIITSQIVRLITTSFYLMAMLRNQRWVDGAFSLLTFIFIFGHFCFLVYIPYRLRQKVG